MPKTLPNLVQRGGVWYVRKMVNGKVHRLTTRQRDRKHAEKVAIDILGKINKGEIDELIGARKKVPVPTYGEAARAFLAVCANKPSTQRNYATHVRPSLDAWKDTRIDAITPTMCLTLLADLRASYATSSLAQFVTLSSMVFNRAIADGVNVSNPWRKVPRKAKPRIEARERVLTHEESDALLAALRGSTARLARVWLGAGLRIGESLKLVPKRHLDFANGLIRLSKDITKNGRARTVPMLPDAQAALSEQLAARKLSYDSNERLFTSASTWVSEQFHAAVIGLKLDGVTPHSLRRTFATRAAQSNRVPMKLLQEWMGHSSITITAKFYTHLDEGASIRAAQEFAATQPAPKVESIARKRAQ